MLLLAFRGIDGRREFRRRRRRKPFRERWVAPCRLFRDREREERRERGRCTRAERGSPEEKRIMDNRGVDDGILSILGEEGMGNKGF